jgi:hypothetical protein
MKLENLNLVELSAQESMEIDGGFAWLAILGAVVLAVCLVVAIVNAVS